MVQGHGHSETELKGSFQPPKCGRAESFKIETGRERIRTEKEFERFGEKRQVLHATCIKKIH